MCICVYMYVYIRIQVYVCIYTYIYACIHSINYYYPRLYSKLNPKCWVVPATGPHEHSMLETQMDRHIAPSHNTKIP